MMSTIADLERQYLQTTLTWLDIRLEQEVRRWQAPAEIEIEIIHGSVAAPSASAQGPNCGHRLGCIERENDVESKK